MEWKLKSSVYSKTAIFEHIQDWKRGIMAKRSRILILMIDIWAGIYIMTRTACMDKCVQHLMALFNCAVFNLRLLLSSLKGTPIGMKLNFQLNDILLDYFAYHVDLWDSFLTIVQPAIEYIFYPVAALGFLGLSFQLAVLSDLLDLVCSHTRCFYIYASMLYKIEVEGMRAMWNVVLGRRKNILKNRIESYNYKNRQLYLATTFFTCLLFLMPTIFVYYIIFAGIKSFLIFLTYFLRMTRKFFTNFPYKASVNDVTFG